MRLSDTVEMDGSVLTNLEADEAPTTHRMESKAKRRSGNPGAMGPPCVLEADARARDGWNERTWMEYRLRRELPEPGTVDRNGAQEGNEEVPR